MLRQDTFGRFVLPLPFFSGSFSIQTQHKDKVRPAGQPPRPPDGKLNAYLYPDRWRAEQRHMRCLHRSSNATQRVATWYCTTVVLSNRQLYAWLLHQQRKLAGRWTESRLASQSRHSNAAWAISIYLTNLWRGRDLVRCGYA